MGATCTPEPAFNEFILYAEKLIKSEDNDDDLHKFVDSLQTLNDGDRWYTERFESGTFSHSEKPYHTLHRDTVLTDVLGLEEPRELHVASKRPMGSGEYAEIELWTVKDGSRDLPNRACMFYSGGESKDLPSQVRIPPSYL